MKRFVIISDIHSNYEALCSVLDAIESEEIENIFCCGDLIGYGADPNMTVELVKKVADGRTITGNHEIAVLKGDDKHIEFFNPVARQAVAYQRAVITDENATWLGNLPESISFQQYQFCHGSPGNLHSYLATENDFRKAFDTSHSQGCRITFFGHTHVPACVSCDSQGTITFLKIVPDHVSGSAEVPLFEDLRYIINPGSVGQPRDENPHASFAICDVERKTIAFRRVSYDIELAMAKIKAAGLPEYLAVRLQYGC